MLYAKFYNKTVVNEFRYFKENAEIVANGETPQMPMLLFTSNDARKQDWPECVQRYAGNVKDAAMIHFSFRCFYVILYVQHDHAEAARLDREDGCEKR